MPRLEHTYTFIVRLWCEPREIEGAMPEWRGSVEIVPTGERKYVTDLAQITDVIAAHLRTRRSRDIRE